MGKRRAWAWPAAAGWTKAVRWARGFVICLLSKSAILSAPRENLNFGKIKTSSKIKHLRYRLCRSPMAVWTSYQIINYASPNKSQSEVPRIYWEKPKCPCFSLQNYLFILLYIYIYMYVQLFKGTSWMMTKHIEWIKRFIFPITKTLRFCAVYRKLS